MVLPYPEVLRLKSRARLARQKHDGAASAAPSQRSLSSDCLFHYDLAGAQDDRLVPVHHRDGLPVDVDGEDLDLSPRGADDDPDLLVRIRLAVNLARCERDPV